MKVGLSDDKFDFIYVYTLAFYKKQSPCCSDNKDLTNWSYFLNLKTTKNDWSSFWLIKVIIIIS